MKLLLLATLLACGMQAAMAANFVCYFPNWAWYRQGDGKYNVEQINPALCTHLVYAFAKLDAATSSIKVFDSWADIDNKMYQKFNALKQKNAKLKTMIAIGGWNDSQDGKYSNLVADAGKIATFVKSVVNFCKTHGFDGLDVDWEYPKTAADKVGFSKLLTALRTAFTPLGYLLSIAVTATPSAIDAGYDVPVVSQNVDFINLMTYDMHGSWEYSTADHHAPLYKRSWETVNNNVDYSVKYWIQKGAAAKKINLGIPVYGRSWVVTSSKLTPPAPAAGGGQAGPITGEAGYMGYAEICNFIKTDGWQMIKDNGNQIGPIAYNPANKNWIGYDDVAMAITKSKYALANGLGGTMIWDMSMDDFLNKCGGGANPMMTAISKTVNP